MFELWIASWCAVSSYYLSPCKQEWELFKSSSSAVERIQSKDTKEFWLYPVRDFRKEEWHFTINPSQYTPAKAEKKP